MATTQRVLIEDIIEDETIQPRSGLDPERVEELTVLYRDAAALPPLDVMAGTTDGGRTFTLLDGWHRLEAARQAERTDTDVIIYTPQEVEAEGGPFLWAVHRSAISAKPLTQAEKRAAIARLIVEHPEMGDREIARHTGTSHPTVASVRSGGKSYRSENERAEKLHPQERLLRALTGYMTRNYAPDERVTAQRVRDHISELSDVEALPDDYLKLALGIMRGVKEAGS